MGMERVSPARRKAKAMTIEQIQDLIAENTRLRAELEAEQLERAEVRALYEALKPKPVVEERYARVDKNFVHSYGVTCIGKPNLKLTFHDGVLVSAEVITDTPPAEKKGSGLIKGGGRDCLGF